jgi:predicted nucleotidyltransferase component of viral defense system
MPITDFQLYVLRLLRKHRNPNSYIAGGIAINRAGDSARLSNDIDFFQDTDEAVSASALSDIETLRKDGCSIQVLLDQPSYWRIVVSRGEQSLKLEWVRDTAFRFYPVIEDEVLGYRLHDVDLAVNKCLALANRSEVRDILDLIQYHESGILVSTACWAACGKDPGFTPEMIIDSMRRNSIIRSEQLAAESVVKKISAPELKVKWLAILSSAEEQLERLPPKDLGCLYINQDGSPADLSNTHNLQKYHRHLGSVGGSWPRIVAT